MFAHRTLPILLLVAICAPAQEPDTYVMIQTTELGAMTRRMAKQDAYIEKLEKQIHDNKVSMGCA